VGFFVAAYKKMEIVTLKPAGAGWFSVIRTLLGGTVLKGMFYQLWHFCGCAPTCFRDITKMVIIFYNK